MIDEFYVVITDKGMDALNNSLLTNTAFDASYIAVGDSNGSYYEPGGNQISLKNQKYKGEVFAKGKRGNYLYFDMQIPPSEGDYTIREAGLFDENNNLLAVAKYPETLKKKAATSSEKSIIIELQLEVSKDVFNTIIIDESGNLLTQEEIDTELSKKANTSLNNLTKTGEKHFVNYSQTTNCITQIPNRIKYALNDGTLTIKAGSVVIFPYGNEDLSSNFPKGAMFLHSSYEVYDTQYANNQFFVWVKVLVDKSSTPGTGWSAGKTAFTLDSNGGFVAGLTSNWYSGSTTPTGSGVLWYDTTNNKCKSTSYPSIAALSFPVLIATVDSNYVLSSINNIFNGAGYIASTFWIDKDIKGLAPDGLNEDGTFKNAEIETNYLIVKNYTSNATTFFTIAIRNNAATAANLIDVVYYYEQGSKPTNTTSYLWLDTTANKLYTHINNSISDVTGQAVPLFFAYRTNNIINTFEVRTPLKINDNVLYNDITLTETKDSYQTIYGKNPSLNLSATPSVSRYGVRLLSYDQNGSWYSAIESLYTEQDVSIVRIGTRIINTEGSFINKYFSCQLNKNGIFNLYADSKLMRYITDTYSSGTSWYRIYSDGWIEQGGRIQVTTKNNATVTFLKAFKNTNYTLSCISERYTSSNTSLTDDIAVTISAMSNSNVTLYPYDAGGDNYTTYVRWEAKGY